MEFTAPRDKHNETIHTVARWSLLNRQASLSRRIQPRSRDGLINSMSSIFFLIEPHHYFYTSFVLSTNSNGVRPFIKRFETAVSRCLLEFWEHH